MYLKHIVHYFLWLWYTSWFKFINIFSSGLNLLSRGLNRLPCSGSLLSRVLGVLSRSLNTPIGVLNENEPPRHLSSFNYYERTQTNNLRPTWNRLFCKRNSERRRVTYSLCRMPLHHLRLLEYVQNLVLFHTPVTWIYFPHHSHDITCVYLNAVSGRNTLKSALVGVPCPPPPPMITCRNV